MVLHESAAAAACLDDKQLSQLQQHVGNSHLQVSATVSSQCGNIVLQGNSFSQDMWAHLPKCVDKNIKIQVATLLKSKAPVAI